MRRLLPACLVLVALLTSCGSSGNASVNSTLSSVPAGLSSKPKVKIPSSIPTTLVITDLIEGTGAAAKNGDEISVNYVGVRSADGTEFDNSYDQGQPFPVTLGAGGVIKGWEQGLVGIKVGGRRQLDIPAELAYGDRGSGDIIKPGDALTFVIDAVSITPGVDVPDADPADTPVVSILASVGATKVTITELVEGKGTAAAAGDTAYVQISAYRGDTAALLQATWTDGKAAKIPLSSDTIPGLVDGITGMQVGGRRLIVVPSDQGFGPDGNVANGLPEVTDLIFVVDLVVLVKN